MTREEQAPDVDGRSIKIQPNCRNASDCVLRDYDQRGTRVKYP